MMKPVVPLDHARRTNWLMKQRNKKQAQVAAQAAHDQSAAAAGDQTKSEAAAEAAAKAATDVHITTLAVQETLDALTKIAAKKVRFRRAVA
jgi:hypothetical protein